MYAMVPSELDSDLAVDGILVLHFVDETGTHQVVVVVVAAYLNTHREVIGLFVRQDYSDLPFVEHALVGRGTTHLVAIQNEIPDLGVAHVYERLPLDLLVSVQ